MEVQPVVLSEVDWVDDVRVYYWSSLYLGSVER